MSRSRASTMPGPVRRAVQALRRLMGGDTRWAVTRKLRRILSAMRLARRIAQMDAHASSTDRQALLAVRIFVEAAVDGRVRNRTGRVRRGLRRSVVSAVPQVAAQLHQPILEAIRRVDRSPEDFDDVTHKLVDVLESTDPMRASPAEWLRLRFVLAGHGFVQASVVARDLARRSAVARVDDADVRTPALLAAGFLSLDAGDPQMSRRAHERLVALDPGADHLRELATFLALATGAHEGFRELAAARRGDADEAMHALVRGRSIAVVGPSPTTEAHGTEIDGHDLVVRMTYTGPDRIGEPETAGSRTDIAYYRRPYYVRPMLDQDDGRVVLPGDLRHAVIERDTSPYTGVPTRLGFKPAAPGIFGIKDTRYQKIQFAVYDLLHFEPARIRIFNTTFYLSRDLYQPGFATPRTAASRPADLCGQFARHDPIGNREFVRAVLAPGGVTADADGRRVLDMPTRQYASGLDQLFGAGQW